MLASPAWAVLRVQAGPEVVRASGSVASLLPLCRQNEWNLSVDGCLWTDLVASLGNWVSGLHQGVGDCLVTLWTNDSTEVFVQDAWILFLRLHLLVFDIMETGDLYLQIHIYMRFHVFYKLFV